MNCPHCQGRNPSGGRYCLHCNAAFEAPPQSDLLDYSGGVRKDMTKGAGLIGTLLVAGVGIAIAVNMAMKGFDTVEYKCTQDLATAQEFEAAPEWTRDTAAESSRRDDYDFQSGRPRESRRRYVVHDRYPNLRCYKKKTGHVDGIEARTKKPSSDGDNGR